MDLVETQTRYVLTYFKSMESIPAQGPCPQLSMNEDSVKPEPLHNGFFCPPGLKLKTQTDNNVCCKCYTSRKQINQLTLASYTLCYANIISNQTYIFRPIKYCFENNWVKPSNCLTKLLAHLLCLSLSN